MYDLLSSLMNPAVIWILIPLAVIIGKAVNRGLQLQNEHKERMARIDAGLLDSAEYEEY